MNAHEVITTARALMASRGVEETYLAAGNFLDFCNQARDVIFDLTKAEQEALVPGFVEAFRKLRDDFERTVQADPMVIYKPAHNIALEFHQSKALIRYFYGGNRISKTQAGAADNYWVLTGQHPYRPLAPLPPSVFLIGSNFSKYAPNVFEKKYLTGETGNPLSPIFPPDGKWFNRYDERKHIIYLCCAECANAGKAQRCTHPKATLTLFSDLEGPGVLAGGQYAQGQLDEQIQEDFFSEAKQRIKTVRNSGLIVTETPLYGKGWWTYSILHKVGTAPAVENSVPGTGQPIVSLHTIDQFAAGLVPHEQITADMRVLSEQQIQARIFGQFVSDSNLAVFDLTILAKMRDELQDAKIGTLTIGDGVSNTEAELLQRASEKMDRVPVKWNPNAAGRFSVWQPPEQHSQYIIGADVAFGLTQGDASCADVFKMTPNGMFVDLEQVAQFHGWVNSHIYAEELFKLGGYYNNAYIAVESNGPGMETLRYLKELGCWFVFQDVSDPTQMVYALDPSLGIDTNVRTKGMLVAILQHAIVARRTGRKSLVIHSEHSLEEFESYIQQPSQTGKSFTFQAHGKNHDDRVMSAALATYVATSYPVFDRERHRLAQEHKKAVTKDGYTKDFWTWIHKDEEARAHNKRNPFFS